MTQSSCKRDTKSKSHPSMKLAAVGVFSCKHNLVPRVSHKHPLREIMFSVVKLLLCCYIQSS